MKFRSIYLFLLTVLVAAAALAAPTGATMPSYELIRPAMIFRAEADDTRQLTRELESRAPVGGDVIVYRTGEGRYSKLLILGTGDALAVRWTTYDAQGEVVSSGDDLVIPEGAWVDLDTGTLLPEIAPEADAVWQNGRLEGLLQPVFSSISMNDPWDLPLPPPPGGGGGGGGSGGGGGGSGSSFGTTLSSITLSQNLLSNSGDADNDGLRDAMENELADKLRPYYKFDSSESHRQSFEPVTLFQVRPNDFCSAGKLKVNIRWVFLFESDGGYGPSSWCNDSHPGDNDSATFYLTSTNGGTTWSVTSITLGSSGRRWPYDVGSLWVYQNTHPVIYQSSHKHHLHFNTSYNHANSPYSAWGCNEDVDGAGAKFISDVKSVGSASTYNNVGELNHHASPFVDSVGEFYPGESAWGTDNFFDVPSNRSKWMTQGYAPAGACACTSGSTRTEECTTSSGTYGTRRDTCDRGIWRYGVCVGGGGPHPE